MKDTNRSRATRAMLARWRRDLATRWVALVCAERELAQSKRRRLTPWELGQLRASLEAERALYLHHARTYRHRPRAYWQRVDVEEDDPDATSPAQGMPPWVARLNSVTPANRAALAAVWWLDYGTTHVAALGGGPDARRWVADSLLRSLSDTSRRAQAPRKRSDPSRPTEAPLPVPLSGCSAVGAFPAGAWGPTLLPSGPAPAPVHPDSNEARGRIAAAKDTRERMTTAWVTALERWQGWPDPTVRRKGGKPVADAAIYRPDAVLLDLLRALGVKKPRPRRDLSSRAHRDAEGLRAQVNRAAIQVRSHVSAIDPETCS